MNTDIQISKLILIIHKNFTSIEPIYLRFTKEGYQCLYASNGLEAIKKLGNKDIFALLVEEKTSPLNAYQTINYIFTELKMSPFNVVLRDPENPGNIDSQVNIHIDGFFDLGGDIEILLKEIDNGKQSKIDSSSYSIGYLKEVSGDNAQFIEESLQLFLNSVVNDIEALYLHINSNSFEEIRQIAHKIKPSFSMVENNRGVEICDRITYKAKDKDLEKLIEELHAEFLKIQNSIKKDYPNLNL
ncbi:Hpt domain-containing protein [Zunongwangia sp. HRR-M8]|uniref:Hpt domain-containing protein n=1 Tax=Zunongwangia sp. HRR-M8 TaxID=3015170 RepID=UPI0022DE751B|nr:Hpt domain-containing protein [Zunongwangia sp. HRR-M8]WBL21156.1 Hpt domain-containing protein [Zunongwangia sp. HRR-M8]